MKALFTAAGLEALLKLPPLFNGLTNDEIGDLFTLSKVTLSATISTNFRMSATAEGTGGA